MAPTPDILTLQEVQKRLRIGKTAMRRLINEEPDFKTIKLGHRRVMRAHALEEFLNKREGAA